MGKYAKACLLKSIPPAFLLLFFLSTVSCTPLMMGQAACEGAMAVGNAAYAASQQDPNENLKNAVNDFNDDFRCEDYSKAVDYVARNQKGKFWSEADRFKAQIRIADNELRNLALDGGKQHATALVHFQYWRPECPTLKTLSVRQKWEYCKKDKKWKVSDTGFDAFPSSDSF